jgi:hypothetical protein
LQEKAENFWIPNETEEKCLADYIEEMIKTYHELNSLKMICTAAAYMQRFYLKESIFIYNPIQIMYACLFLASKIEEMGYT